MTREDATTSAALDPAEEVRAFYESHPYPATLRSLDEQRELYRSAGRRRAVEGYGK
jgi:hypothetical protein